MPTPPLLQEQANCSVDPGTLAFLIQQHGSCSRTRLIWAVPLQLSTASHTLQGQASSLAPIKHPSLPTPSSQPTCKQLQGQVDLVGAQASFLWPDLFFACFKNPQN